MIKSYELDLICRAEEHSSILGIFIPRDTLILANIWAVHNDPKTWENPHYFNPYRFLSYDCKELIQSDYFIPFSIGKNRLKFLLYLLLNARNDNSFHII